jgi:hypothetical protein
VTAPASVASTAADLPDDVGADVKVFTRTTTFAIMQSLRLDRGLGVSRPVHP